MQTDNSSFYGKFIVNFYLRCCITHNSCNTKTIILTCRSSTRGRQLIPCKGLKPSVTCVHTVNIKKPTLLRMDTSQFLVLCQLTIIFLFYKDHEDFLLRQPHSSVICVWKWLIHKEIFSKDMTLSMSQMEFILIVVYSPIAF